MVRRGTEHILRKSVIAHFDGKCPYPLCRYDGRIREGEDIVKGELGWGHAECVTTKIHFEIEYSGGHPICSTRQTWSMRTTYNWAEVTCEKCLQKKNGYEKRLKETENPCASCPSEEMERTKCKKGYSCERREDYIKTLKG